MVPRGLRGVVAKALVDLLTDYRERHGVEFSALAASSVYGTRQRPGVRSGGDAARCGGPR